MGSTWPKQFAKEEVWQAYSPTVPAIQYQSCTTLIARLPYKVQKLLDWMYPGKV